MYRTIRLAFLWLLLSAGLLVHPCVAGSGVFADTGGFTTRRYEHTATLLHSGKVLVAGAISFDPAAVITDLYDPASGTWTATGNLAVVSFSFRATLLANGKVLIAGGYVWDFDMAVPFAGAELYDPASGTWTVTGSLATARYYHSMTLLPNGKVLVAGGSSGAAGLASAELYDPASGTWITTGSLATTRSSHTATLLPNGKVLVVGGVSGSYLASAELYDPANGTWTTTGSLSTARFSHTATLLPNGKVLVAGGNWAGPGSLTSAELYDPANGIWTSTGSLAGGRYDATATLMANGKVLVAGGSRAAPGGGVLATAELYSPVDGIWATTGSLGTPRVNHSAALLPNGRVLISAGYSGIGGDSTPTTAKLYIGPPAPEPVSVSGSVTYCSSPVSVPNVTFNLTGSGADATLSDGSGNYQFPSLVPNASYIVMPTKSALMPASPGISTMDVIAAQRHFLNVAFLMGCRLTAGDVNGDTAIDTIDVIAIQRFFLAFSTGIANTGKYHFIPSYRSYPGIVSNQTAQNYDTLIFGDVAPAFSQ